MPFSPSGGGKATAVAREADFQDVCCVTARGFPSFGYGQA